MPCKLACYDCIPAYNTACDLRPSMLEANNRPHETPAGKIEVKSLVSFVEASSFYTHPNFGLDKLHHWWHGRHIGVILKVWSTIVLPAQYLVFSASQGIRSSPCHIYCSMVEGPWVKTNDVSAKTSRNLGKHGLASIKAGYEHEIHSAKIDLHLSHSDNYMGLNDGWYPIKQGSFYSRTWSMQWASVDPKVLIGRV